MKTTAKCPKCGSTRLGRLDMQLDMVGLTQEARVCVECGYYETYVKDPAGVPFEQLKGFRWVNEAPTSTTVGARDPRLYNLHRDERQRVANYFEPGMSVDRLSDRDDFGSWTVVSRADGEWIMRHNNGAMMRVTISADTATDYVLLEGDAAVALDAALRSARR